MLDGVGRIEGAKSFGGHDYQLSCSLRKMHNLNTQTSLCHNLHVTRQLQGAYAMANSKRTHKRAFHQSQTLTNVMAN